jgi:hypothetical protein
VDRLKRANEVEGLAIVREFHDHELSQYEPDQKFLDDCRKLVEIVTERHAHEDAKEAGD